MVLLIAPAFAGAARANEPAAKRFSISLADSKLTFKAYRDGWFSSLGHDHTIAARDFAGAVAFDAAKPEASSVTITVSTAALEVLDPGVDAKDKAEIAKTLKSDEVLDVGRFPEMRFKSTAVRARAREGGSSTSTTTARLELEVSGDLTLRGRTRSIKFELTLEPPAAKGSLKAEGTIAVNQSDFGMKPYGVGLGAVKVKDQVELEFSVVAKP